MTYNIKLNVFEGPFDLLVYLIEKAQMDIYDIQISEITQQYIDYMEMMKKFNLEVAAEFLVLAATLIEIKSRMLLPNKEAALNENIEEIDPRTELVQKILEYKKFKNAAEELKEREEIASHIYFKVKEDIGYQNGNSEYIDLDLDQFIQAFNLFLKKKKKIFDIQKKYLEVESEKISIEDKIKQIKNYFKHNEKVDFENLISDQFDKYEIITTFMALLELIKQRIIIAQQHIIFGSIVLTKMQKEK